MYYWSRKKSIESNVATSKKEMEDEWDVEVICAIEEDELALMVMMREHIDYEDKWIIDSRYSNHMFDDQNGAMDVGWPLENEVLPDLNNIKEILPHNTKKQTKYIWLGVDVFEDPSDINVGE